MPKRFAAAAAISFCALFGVSSAAVIDAAVAPDPFYMNDTQHNTAPIRDVSSKVLSTQSVNTGVQNCVLIGAGQSNSPGTNVAPTPFTPANPNALDFINPYDGGIYKGTDPVVGGDAVHDFPPNGAAPILRVGDALITAGKCARVIVAAVGIDGTSIAEWSTGPYAARLSVAIKRLAAKGITAQANVTFAILWGQGETDNTLGTSSAAYQAAFAAMKANAISAGYSGRWLVARQTLNGSTSATIQAAQAAVVNGVDVFAGANADALAGSVCVGSTACRQADGLHWTDTGSASYATDATNGWVAALHATGLPF